LRVLIVHHIQDREAACRKKERKKERKKKKLISSFGAKGALSFYSAQIG